MERKTVNLYIDTSLKGPRRAAGAYGYVLESMTAAGPATYTNIKRLEDTTGHMSLLAAVLDAAGHLTSDCNICLYTDSEWIQSAVSTWLPQWRENGWKNGKGREPAGVGQWKKLDGYLKRHHISVQVSKDHAYWIYLERETAAVAAGKAFTPL